jgi:hypothetical protein
VTPTAPEFSEWWCGRYDLLHRLECPSTRIDPTIKNLPATTLRRNPDLRKYRRGRGLGVHTLLGYEALADTPFGLVRLVAVFRANPFEGGEPDVLALDGERRSLHRNNGGNVNGGSAHLCLYYPKDPEERRWLPEYGLIGLFDMARRHLNCEHVWRETGDWPVEDAAHGNLARPVASRPELRVPLAWRADPEAA